MYNLSKIIVSLFGIGFFPWAPGTIASITSVIFFYVIINYISIHFMIISFVIIFILSLKFISYYSYNKLNHDSKEIVIDEFLGIHMILIFYNFFSFKNNFLMFVLLFFIFRFFDIIKPFPIKSVDKKIKNSFGVIFDDLLAGLYTIICLLILDVYL
jgi:phosphatidylglycerophosphatase A